jgi:hypothetical protein
MATDDDNHRRQAIVTAIAAELQRQGKGGVDVDAVAQAVELALDPAPPTSEGKHPDELNATNDD